MSRQPDESLGSCPSFDEGLAVLSSQALENPEMLQSMIEVTQRQKVNHETLKNYIYI